MSEIENIVCIKEASGDVRRITDLFNALGDRYLIFSGLDDVADRNFNFRALVYDSRGEEELQRFR